VPSPPLVARSASEVDGSMPRRMGEPCVLTVAGVESPYVRATARAEISHVHAATRWEPKCSRAQPGWEIVGAPVLTSSYERKRDG
jgi:hypothetical protein